ncbi:MAG TPA: HD domain-containing protein, partial [Candidatus Aenigmarchaeota archaeon]|nr:HD domain-containing protein [Candidatus Aenigmarchaeota archaeon]
VEKYPKCKKVIEILFQDPEINALLEQANRVSIGRLGYNDHGPVHAKIVVLNSLKIYEILREKFEANILKEKIGSEEDVLVVLCLGSYLHDIGVSITRDLHEILGVILVKEKVKEILTSLYDIEKASKMLPIVLECIACHMGNLQATSLEARIVEVSDGTDITKGRARIPFHIGKEDIHKFSALAINEIKIMKGEEKPIKILVEMDDSAGIFQIEETLLKKVKGANFEDLVEVIAHVEGKGEFTYP